MSGGNLQKFLVAAFHMLQRAVALPTSAPTTLTPSTSTAPPSAWSAAFALGYAVMLRPKPAN